MTKRVIKLIIALIFRAVERLLGFFQKNKERAGSLVVLMYHEVGPDHLDHFVRQMDMIKNLALATAASCTKELINGKVHAAVTFDDGFANTIERVLPVLEEKNIPATFFIPIAFLGMEPTWITDITRRNLVGPVVDSEYLEQLSHHGGITIGSHGVTHRRLTELSIDDAHDELLNSKNFIEKIIGKKVKLHAFPYGAFSESHTVIAKNSGYDHAYTVNPTVFRRGMDDFLLGRVEVSPSDWNLEFKLKLLGAYRWHPFVSTWKYRLKPKGLS